MSCQAKLLMISAQALFAFMEELMTEERNAFSGKPSAMPEGVSAKTIPIVSISVTRGHYLSDGTGWNLSVMLGSVTLYFGWSSWKAQTMAGRVSSSMATATKTRAKRRKAVSSSTGGSEQPLLSSTSENSKSSPPQLVVDFDALKVPAAPDGRVLDETT